MNSVVCMVLAIILYTLISIDQFRQKDYCHSFIWFSYAQSQVGFLIYELSKGKI